jgi:hypothetical protein
MYAARTALEGAAHHLDDLPSVTISHLQVLEKAALF